MIDHSKIDNKQAIADEKIWTDIRMLKDGKGAIQGLHVMDFLTGKKYHVDLKLAKSFIKMGLAAIDGTEDVAFVLNIDEGPSITSKNWSPIVPDETK